MITASDDRAKAMLEWLTNDLKLPITHFTPASSDASFRRYFRVHYEQQPYIVMDAPPEKEAIAPFIEVAEILAHSGVNVPQIIEQNRQQGFLLLQDFGSQCYLDSLNKATKPGAEQLYKDALNSLLTLQKNIDITRCTLPRYNTDLLNTELQLFSDWFIAQQCSITLDAAQQAILANSYTLLINSALQQTQVCVHRDYHSRNLMHVTHNNPGIIDFQDAVIGAVTYDVVSLLRDCYINWPDASVEYYLQYYHKELKRKAIINCEYAQFKRDFDLMGIQRHLKAIGIFSRLHIRDGKSGYLHDIPRTLNYVMQVSQLYPELQAFHELLHTTVLPVYA